MTVRSLRRFLDDACSAGGSRSFLHERGREWSYQEFGRLTDAGGAALLQLGLQRGERLAVILPTGHEALFTWLSAAKVGLVVCPLNPELPPAELIPALEHLDPSLVVTSHEIAALLPARWRIHDKPTELWESGLALSGAPETDPDRPAEILTTSGTTGRPKGAVLSGRMAVLSGEAFAAWLKLEPSDRLFTCLPLSHINARFYSSLGAIAAGASLALEPRFSASRFWNMIAASGATQCNLIGAMLKILIDRPSDEQERRHRLRLIYAAPAIGEPMHAEIERRFGARLVIGYGLTESTFGFIHPLDDSRVTASMGKPRRHPNPLIRADWSLSTSGEVLLKNDAMFDGYFRDPGQSAAAFQDGWLRTGDLARIDLHGHWHFVGRSKQVIRRRGENMTPAEIEQAIEQHPAIKEAAVIGVPSSLGEEELRAFVVFRAGQSASFEELAEFCATRLARFKIPGEWRVLEALPRTATLRIAYGKLKEL